MTWDQLSLAAGSCGRAIVPRITIIAAPRRIAETITFWNNLRSHSLRDQVNHFLRHQPCHPVWQRFRWQWILIIVRRCAASIHKRQNDQYANLGQRRSRIQIQRRLPRRCCQKDENINPRHYPISDFVKNLEMCGYGSYIFC